MFYDIEDNLNPNLHLYKVSDPLTTILNVLSTLMNVSPPFQNIAHQLNHLLLTRAKIYNNYSKEVQCHYLLQEPQ